ncbi:glycosyltransferase family 1 protein [Chryseomicrobium excrementi]|uniref:Glycosyltransferase family 1 protein n=1 Tax=Chryseomicrobium excrementi TaxID=2041346 RepID=A0A2M9F0C5_9BACL|nr:glycosyltransferase family 4 protein [Chryseomicrobium excrementi]PJK16912.1 glycosyltransferase family 1 protein [Chryseomicrobium excrementi]
MKKKIMLLGNHGFVIYNFRKELIKKLLDDGHEVYVSLPYDEKVEIMKSWGCKFIETNVDRRGTNPVTDSKLVKHYIEILRSVKPDVVLTYTIKPNLYGGLACRILKIPYISNITGLGSGFNGNPILRNVLTQLYKAGLKKANCVFFQNTEDMKELTSRGIIRGDYKLIPGSGVNLDEFKFHPLPEGDTVNFLFIGRIMKDKGIEEYLKAAEKIKKEHKNVKFNVVGFIESTHSHYKEWIDDLNDRGVITYHGYQKDVKPFIVDSHCLIQPSHGGEGLSNVLLEAGAMGRILIASDIAGCRETITGKNGYTFKKKSFESLVKALDKFINKDNDEKIEMGLLSRQHIELNFNRNIVVKKYLKEINTND